MITTVLTVLALVVGMGFTLAWIAYDTAQHDRTVRNVQVRAEADAALQRLTTAAEFAADVMTDIAGNSRSQT